MIDSIGDVTLVPIIMGLVEILKKFGLSPQYAALASIAIGVVIVGLGTGWSSAGVLNGIVLGLSASGLWSGGKAVIGK